MTKAIKVSTDFASTADNPITISLQKLTEGWFKPIFKYYDLLQPKLLPGHCTRSVIKPCLSVELNVTEARGRITVSSKCRGQTPQVFPFSPRSMPALPGPPRPWPTPAPDEFSPRRAAPDRCYAHPPNPRGNNYFCTTSGAPRRGNIGKARRPRRGQEEGRAHPRPRPSPSGTASRGRSPKPRGPRTPARRATGDARRPEGAQPHDTQRAGWPQPAGRRGQQLPSSPPLRHPAFPAHRKPGSSLRRLSPAPQRERRRPQPPQPPLTAGEGRWRGVGGMPRAPSPYLRPSGASAGFPPQPAPRLR